MKPGPRPAPTKLRLLTGEKRASRINYREPTPPDVEPAPPTELSADGRKVWEYTAATLRTVRVLAEPDRDLFAIYCEHVVNHVEMIVLMRKSGMLVKGQKGNVVRNPIVGMARQEAALLRTLAHEFGLSPSARTQLHAPLDTPDEIERLLSG